MQLVIAEKPSVGIALAKVLGATNKKVGCFEGENIIVSWCVGHLVGLANADSYDEKYKKWCVDELPIIPNKWQFVVSDKKNKQFETVRKLMNDNRVTKVVNACDAGREGELIFRLVYNKAGCNKPIKRFWISSMEEQAIRDGFSSLKDGKDFENLYQSSLCRAKADWIIGINATRLFSKLYNKKLNVGRVQTPTLEMICERERQINGFQREKYFNIHLKSAGLDAVIEKINTQKEADSIIKECEGANAIVKSIRTDKRMIQPPKLYDLTTLQREANRIYGFTAQQTLDYTQSLYEMKLCTYPRTDSCYLTEDMEYTAKSIAEIVVRKLPQVDSIVLNENIKRILNNKKVSDHTAIIPTAEIENTDINTIPECEKKILFLISNRLLCAISEPNIYETVTAEISCGGYSFVARGRKIISEGFKNIEKALKKNKECEEENAESYSAIALSEGQTFEHLTMEISEHYTQPPKHFTEDTLLSAMERAGADEFIESAEHSGLGTPATRASIIEKLIKAGFIKREKRNLIATEKGRELVSIVPETIKSAKMTADWENKLFLVSQGKFTPQQFMADIEKLTEDIIVTAKDSVDETKVTLGKRNESIGICPRCGKNIIVTPKAYSCEDRNCGFTIWKNDRFFEAARKPITKEKVTTLIKRGKLEVKGLYSQKSDRYYDATICLDDKGKYVNFKLDFNSTKAKEVEINE